MKRLSTASFLFLFLSILASCASARKEASAPQSAGPARDSAPSTPAATGNASPAGQPQGGYPQEPGAYAPPPPPAAEPARPSSEPSSTPPNAPSGTQSRALALQKASSDIDAAQRELDVAGSSCQNACRALGSMDRAAGHLCQLTREESTHDRCDDAKRRLYNARDRVRNTCGTCPDNQPATDRNAPVPSVR